MPRVPTFQAPMKFLFLFWIAIRGILDVSIEATAAWCALYSFSSVSWLQCFWIILAVHFVGNLSFVKIVRTQTREDCFAYIRRESMLVGLSIISAPILAILPTVAVIVLLSLLQVWTNLETHWLHTWLLVTCLAYILLRVREARKMALRAKSQRSQSPGSIWKTRSDSVARFGAKDAVEQPPHRDWIGSRKPPGKNFGSAPKAPQSPRSRRVIDV
jgi:hypothetical protein